MWSPRQAQPECRQCDPGSGPSQDGVPAYGAIARRRAEPHSPVRLDTDASCSPRPLGIATLRWPAGEPHCIGGNSFLEMGFAHILDIPIYVIQPVPEYPSTAPKYSPWTPSSSTAICAELQRPRPLDDVEESQQDGNPQAEQYDVEQYAYRDHSAKQPTMKLLRSCVSSGVSPVYILLTPRPQHQPLRHRG